jgi:RNA-directed DNA polymerase
MHGEQLKLDLSIPNPKVSHDELHEDLTVAETCMAQPENKRLAEEEKLMEKICERENMLAAMKQVQRNKGSCGVDGMNVEQLHKYLKRNWPQLRNVLLEGTYKPQVVKAVEIDKPGGGKRRLGIPVVVDRMVEQAILQQVSPLWEPSFSKHSYAFMRGRSQHQAVAEAQGFIRQGYTWCVDIDLSKFFDRINHDRLMSRLSMKIKDKRLLKLIGGFLRAGILVDGVVIPTDQGTPQGSPLSPLLSNVVLDELDKELEHRKLHFVRYADDCNIYVGSKRAAERVMRSIRKFITHKLKLKVNDEKSAVGQPWNRKFLGFTFRDEEQHRSCVSSKSIKEFKRHVRELTGRCRGRSVDQIIGELSTYLRGWLSYYGRCGFRTQFKDLDAWIRRRLRALYWKQWKTPKRRLKELLARGVNYELARNTSGSGKGPWAMSRTKALSYAFPNAYFRASGLFFLNIF